MAEYSYATVVLAEGARVGLITCLTCGAAVLNDHRDVDAGINAIELHNRWHEEGGDA